MKSASSVGASERAVAPARSRPLPFHLKAKSGRGAAIGSKLPGSREIEDRHVAADVLEMNGEQINVAAIVANVVRLFLEKYIDGLRKDGLETVQRYRRRGQPSLCA